MNAQTNTHGDASPENVDIQSTLPTQMVIEGAREQFYFTRNAT